MQYAYQDIAEDILRRIRSGEWKEGESIPGLGPLEKIYPQSRMTIYKALRYLTDQGYLAMSRGKGTIAKTGHLKPRVGIVIQTSLLRPQTTPFAFLLLGHAQDYFASRGIDAHIYTEDLSDEHHLPADLMEDMEKKRLSGVLSIQSPAARIFVSDNGNRPSVPVVGIDCFEMRHRVYVDEEAFVDRAVVATIEAGGKSVALAGGGTTFPADYFVEQMTRAGVEIWQPDSEGELPDAGHTEEWGYEWMRAVLNSSTRPDIILARDDVVTKGVAQCALVHGVSVPDDIVIMSLANRESGIFYPLPVIPITVATEEIVATAGDMLSRLINDPELPPETVLVPPEPLAVAAGQA